jgi:hypothetical protein
MHNALEGGDLTGENLLHIGSIVVSRHYRSLRYDHVISEVVAFLFRKESATGAASFLSDQVHEQTAQGDM